MRISVVLQVTILAVVLGLMFRHTPAAAHPSTWPFVLAGIGALLLPGPWLSGAYLPEERTVGHSIGLGVLCALPLALSARWLMPTPYRIIAIGCWVLVGLWGVHLLSAVAHRLVKTAP